MPLRAAQSESKRGSTLMMPTCRTNGLVLVVMPAEQQRMVRINGCLVVVVGVLGTHTEPSTSVNFAPSHSHASTRMATSSSFSAFAPS